MGLFRLSNSKGSAGADIKFFRLPLAAIRLLWEIHHKVIPRPTAGDREQNGQGLETVPVDLALDHHIPVVAEEDPQQDGNQEVQEIPHGALYSSMSRRPSIPAWFSFGTG